ncbi:MAG: hypothetical protein CL609_09585 [Anaerolineaceae bacterium]|nr:hypothetical protein [Anaerolineaceae bacterium]
MQDEVYLHGDVIAKCPTKKRKTNSPLGQRYKKNNHEELEAHKGKVGWASPIDQIGYFPDEIEFHSDMIAKCPTIIKNIHVVIQKSRGRDIPPPGGERSDQPG